METKTITIDYSSPLIPQLYEAGKIIKAGGIVAFPTETVYGLGADAQNPAAVEKIFKAKGRPQDNPLIAHICDIKWVDRLCIDVPKKAYLLMEKFWPGPLTIILKRSRLIPDTVTCCLDTVGIRMPSHPVALAFIEASGTPIAAPSANISGRPSPTSFSHTYEDMNGRADMIISGGDCSVGVESTIIDMTSAPPRLLRPGGITLEALRNILGDIKVDECIKRSLRNDEVARAPGMKYRHYAPKAKVIVVCGEDEKVISYLSLKCKQEKCGILCFDETIPLLPANKNTVIYSYGSKLDQTAQARKLFSLLRAFDKTDVSVIYAQCPGEDGISLAVRNRLFKAAGFETVNI
jgi:L-threonylcarbamoyladenylate synthase